MSRGANLSNIKEFAHENLKIVESGIVSRNPSSNQFQYFMKFGRREVTVIASLSKRRPSHIMEVAGGVAL